MLRIALGAASSGAPRPRDEERYCPQRPSGETRRIHCRRNDVFGRHGDGGCNAARPFARLPIEFLRVAISRPRRRSAAVNDRRPGPPGARVFERGIDGENGVVPSKGTASPPSFSPFRRFSSPRLVAGTLYDHTRNPPMLAETHYFRRAGRAITVGISTFGVASPKALNCSGFRNITEHCAQA